MEQQVAAEILILLLLAFLLPFEKSPPALCTPLVEFGFEECFHYNVIIYIVSDGPRAVGSEAVAASALEQRANAPKGDPEFREINLMSVCFDLQQDPASRQLGIRNRCVKVQYPGFLQFEVSNLRVREETWSYASLGVTRTGGSDLGVTVDYRTWDYPNRTNIDDARSIHRPAIGGGVDFFSKIGQLRWTEGDALTKYIIVPIKDDDLWELHETFDVSISSVVNASMSSNTQTAVVTIVGMNDTPRPKYIENITVIIGAVVGVSTILPLSLFAARLIRSLRRGHEGRGKIGKRDVAQILAHDKMVAQSEVDVGVGKKVKIKQATIANGHA
uniref:Calx-beta domain-containing protein n=1 Tax=Hemiselmis andersenii TaxID=464988 RepID=A0A7S0UA15_HEMAN